jgi:hypothetical protein
MYGSIYRMQKWVAKVKGTRLQSDLTALLPNMTARMSGATSSICAMETATKQVLDGEGVPTIQYPFYLDFSRSCWSYLNREFSGESLAQVVAVHVAKWVARGLTQSVLEAVRTQVHSIPAPLAP